MARPTIPPSQPLSRTARALAAGTQANPISVRKILPTEAAPEQVPPPTPSGPFQMGPPITAPTPSGRLITGAGPQITGPAPSSPIKTHPLPSAPIVQAANPRLITAQPHMAQGQLVMSTPAQVPPPPPTSAYHPAVVPAAVPTPAPSPQPNYQTAQSQSPVQSVARRPRLLTVGGEEPQTPQSIAQATEAKGQDPDQASFDASVTSVGDIPYYSLSQVMANYAANEPSVILELDPLQETATVPLPEPAQGPRYDNETKIGEGGTSVVYLAHDTRIRRRVALKRFKKVSRSNDQSDYLNELESASRISHPYVVSTYDADVDATGRYIVMEYIDGVDMETAIGKGQIGFDLNRFMNFAVKALEGLDATHKAGLLHLDLKPSNIMLTVRESGRDIVKIIDFGRARRSMNDDGVPPRGLGLNGSIFYSAPEQLLSEKLDARTDLYALGCIFYWVLAKTRPFDGPNPVTIMSSHLRHEVKDILRIVPTLPEWLAELIMSMISLEKSDRPASAQVAMMILGSEGDLDKVTQFQA